MNAKELQQKVRHALSLRKKKSRSHDSEWSAIAIRGSSDDPAGLVFTEGELNFEAHKINSLLEMRCLLQEADEKQTRKVFLVDFDSRDFPGDIKARILNGTLQDMDIWQLILSRFEANRCDRKIPNNEEVVNALLQFEPLDGYEKCPAGFLSHDHFWSSLIRHGLNFDEEMNDSAQLLIWALDSTNVKRCSDFHPEVRKEMYRWLEKQHALVSFVLKCAVENLGDQLIPLGMVSTVLFSTHIQDDLSIAKAQVRFEQFIKVNELDLKLQREWASAADRALAKVSLELRERLLNKADQFVQQFGLQEFASESSLLLSGFSQRIVNFAKSCDLCLQGQLNIDQLTVSLKQVLEHSKCQSDPNRADRMQMLVRLIRWLMTDEVTAKDLTAFCRVYRSDLSHVDLARGIIGGGDSITELQTIYSKVSSLCLERREKFNLSFAQEVVSHRLKSKKDDEVKGIERVLDDIVVPIAEHHKCLVLVMDGMSWAVAHELLPDFERNHWTLRRNESWSFDQPSIITTVPSVTEHGRMSLLSGRVAQGHQQEEKNAFEEHSGLKKMTGSGGAPVLFHKGDLENIGRNGLTDQVRNAIENNRNKVVGLVINSIDDHLAKDDMKLHRWELKNIRLLETILESAKKSKRVLVICSDHGHVEATWSKGKQSNDGGERWQPSHEDLKGCIKVEKPHSAYKKNDLVACWSEQHHFGVKKNGYHGGVSPQELIAPCVVMAQMDVDIKGWTETPILSPEWWSGEAVVAKPMVQVKTADPAVDVEVQTGSSWIDAFMVCHIFISSCKQAGRRRAKDEDIKTILSTLDQAHGLQLSENELGKALGLSNVRMRGFMAQVSMILNIEGYQIIEYTTDGKHIRLNKELLTQQFGLE